MNESSIEIPLIRFTKIPTREKPAFSDRTSVIVDDDNEAEYFSTIVAPICISEIILDHADTLHELLRETRIPELKPLSHFLREISFDFVIHYHRAGVKDDSLADVRSWAQIYLDHTDGSGPVYAGILSGLREQSPEITGKYQMLCTQICMVAAYTDALIRHTEAAEKRLARKMRLPNVGHVLAKPIYQLHEKLIPALAYFGLTYASVQQATDFLTGIFVNMGSMMYERRERRVYRQSCIAFRRHGGCHLGATEGEKIGCCSNTRCTRMREYDNRQQITNTPKSI